MTSCNSCQYLGKILAKIFQDLAKILLRYPWRVDPGSQSGFHNRWSYLEGRGRFSPTEFTGRGICKYEVPPASRLFKMSLGKVVKNNSFKTTRRRQLVESNSLKTTR